MEWRREGVLDGRMRSVEKIGGGGGGGGSCEGNVF